VQLVLPGVRARDRIDSMGYLFLAAAILSEVIATLSLRASDGFTKWPFVAVLVVGYVLSFVGLSAALGRDVPLGLAYGIWAAVGVASVAVLSIPLFGETLTGIQVGGLVLVIAGVVALELGAASH
jgi:small multidrug resistance pump